MSAGGMTSDTRKNVGAYCKAQRTVMRAALYKKQRGQCFYCRKPFPPEELTDDHVVPRSKGGRRHSGNVVLACYTCNQRKGSLSAEEFWATRADW